MNPEFEVVDLTDEGTAEPEPFRTLAKCEEEVQTIALTDDASVDIAMLLMAKLQEVEKDLTAERRQKTDPLREEIDRISKPYAERIEKAKSLRLLVKTKLDDYRAMKLREAQEAQRKAIQAAEAERLRKEREAEQARLKAEEARAQGDEVGAAKFEGKAQRAELAAVTTVPEVIPTVPKTQKLLDGSSLTFKETKDWVFTSGLPRGTAYYRDDPRLKDVPDEFFKLDETAVGQRVRTIKSPQPDSIPGIQIVSKTTTALRKST